MAIYSLSTSNVSRANLQSSVASYAYISGEEVTDERTGQLKKYTRQDKILAKGNILPDDAPQRYKDNAATWVNDIELYEQADNARPCKKYVMALPRELDLEQQRATVEQWIKQNCTEHGYAATYAIHQSKDGKNPHVHILVANRALKNGKWQRTKSKTVYKLDQNGKKIPMLDEHGNQKVRVRPGKGVEKLWEREKLEESYLDRKDTLQTMRESWATTCNQYLDQNHKIDHRSYKARGIVKAPTIHEGYEARAIEQRGGVSWRCEHNRQVKDINRQYRQAFAEEVALEKNLAGIQSDLKSMAKVASTGRGATGAIQSDEQQLQGMDKVMSKTARDLGMSLIRLDPVGTAKAIGGLPLGIMANVESDEVKRDKMREAMEQAEGESILPGGKRKPKKEKSKGKDKGGQEQAPVRSRGR